MTHIAVLGGGPAGYVAALRARQLGAEVTLVEMDALGGTCSNRGCIPTKALLRSAEVARDAQELDEYGVLGTYEGMDWARVMERKARIVENSVKGIEYLVEQGGIRLVRGRGRLVDGHTIAVETEGKNETIAADRLILATGSAPSRLPLPGFEPPGVITSDEMLEIEEIPQSLAIIGAGPIGVEFAEVFSAAGTEVTIIELLSRIVPGEDEEISVELARTFRRRRVQTFLNARVSEVVERDGKRVVRFTHNETEREVEADLVLSAVGRRPNTDGIGLGEAGIALDRGAITVNEKMETTIPGVYAAGDAIGGILLAHVAWAEGKVAAANAAGESAEMDYRAIPSVVFTHPEIGSTGVTEAQAQERGIDVKVGRFSFRAVGRASAEGRREGLAKIVSEAATGKIIGGHIIGARATDLIHEVVLAVQLGATAEELGRTIHAHPTLSEAAMEAAEDTLGRSVHK